MPSRPAPGFRYYDTGTLGNGVGNNGYSWSSTISGIYGQFLWFHSHGLAPGSANVRAYGFQLRCLSE